MWIKICGFCDTESARNALEIGVDAIGLNFVRRSKRYVSVERARDVADIVRGKVEIVGVVDRITVTRVSMLVLNVAIVAYLVWRRVKHLKAEGRG